MEFSLAEDKGKVGDRSRRLYTLAVVNTAMWALSVIALVFVVQRAPSARGLFVILGGGTTVPISLLSALGKVRSIERHPINRAVEVRAGQHSSGGSHAFRTERPDANKLLEQRWWWSGDPGGILAAAA